MSFSLMLFRAPESSDAATVAAGIWDADAVDEVSGVRLWTHAEQVELARQLRDADRRLRKEPHEGEDCTLYLSTETDPGIDYEVRPHSVLIDFDIYGVAREAARALLVPTLQVLDRMTFGTGLHLWSPQLRRLVDARRDETELTTRYQRACAEKTSAGMHRGRLLPIVVIVGMAIAALVIVMLLRG